MARGKHLDEYFDYVVIGAGIAGLYAAHRLLRERPGASLLVLELAGRPGGRAGEARFAGLRVKTGAGVGRLRKDRLLTALLRDLGVPWSQFPAFSARSPALPAAARRADVMAEVGVLREAFAEEAAFGVRPRVSFRAFALRHLGAKRYDAMLLATGYSDFEAADAEDALWRYGMEDNASRWTGMSIVWTDLVHALRSSVSTGGGALRLGCTVTDVSKAESRGGNRQYVVTVTQTEAPTKAQNKTIRCGAVVAAVPGDALRALFPEKSEYRSVLSQPFLRVYAQLAPRCRAAVARAAPVSTVVPPPLQKVIPIDARRGVYMAAYADNASAEALRRFWPARGPEEAPDDSIRDSEPNQAGCRDLAALLDAALALPPGTAVVDRMQAHAWRAGTHAFGPLPSDCASRAAFLRLAARPMGAGERVYAVGEALAERQGWVEGALRSVAAALPAMLKGGF